MVQFGSAKNAEKVHHPYYCEKCDYVSSDKRNYTKHLTTRKHRLAQSRTAKNAAKVREFYQCNLCAFICYKESNYAAHLTTRKHCFNEKNAEKVHSILRNKSRDDNGVPVGANIVQSLTYNSQYLKNAEKVHSPRLIYGCDQCDKEYASKSAMTRHRKKTHVSIDAVLADNVNLRQTIIDLSKTMRPTTITNNITNTNSNNNNVNSHNKTFNLNFFLNETCKDAMNISEFIDTIQVSLGELERVGDIGFIKGIADIITAKLDGLALTKRPIHCSDLKRETLYVKDDGAWAKEPVGHPKMNRLIQHVSHKNLGTLRDWREAHPDYDNPVAHDSDKYQTLIAVACNIDASGGKSSNGHIVKRVSKRVVIEKE